MVSTANRMQAVSTYPLIYTRHLTPSLRLHLMIHYPLWGMQTPSFSNLCDGDPMTMFKSQGGLRQGDPISPILFNLAMDNLNQCSIPKLG